MFVIFVMAPLALQVAQSHTISGKLPATLDPYLSTVVRSTPAERNSLLAGKPIAKLLDADPNAEVAVLAEFGSMRPSGGMWRP
jgi:hypothetical protein